MLIFKYQKQHLTSVYFKVSKYLCEAANLFDWHVESEEIQRLATHCWEVAHAHGLLLSECKVLIYPHLPLGLLAELIQAGDLLAGDGGGTRLLQEKLWNHDIDLKKIYISDNNNFVNRFISATFLDSVLGVPSTLLFIFWAGFSFSMPNSELGAIPACLAGK